MMLAAWAMLPTAARAVAMAAAKWEMRMLTPGRAECRTRRRVSGGAAWSAFARLPKLVGSAAARPHAAFAPLSRSVRGLFHVAGQWFTERDGGRPGPQVGHGRSRAPGRPSRDGREGAAIDQGVVADGSKPSANTRSAASAKVAA